MEHLRGRLELVAPGKREPGADLSPIVPSSTRAATSSRTCYQS
jgi:hypothetical protein